MFKLIRLGLITLISIAFVIGSLGYAGKLKYIVRMLDEAPFVSTALKRIHRETTQHFHKLRIDLPSSGIKQVLKTGKTATATTAATLSSANIASAPTSFPLYIKPSEKNAKIKVLNIGPVYRPGIRLKPGNYYISVEKPNFRSKKFWITIEQNSPTKEYTFDVTLQPTGLPNCEQNLELSNYNSGIAGFDGRILQVKARYPNTSIHDLYAAFAADTDNVKYFKLLHDEVTQNYAEFHIAQPSHLSEEAIKQNKKLDVDQERFVMHVMSFEQQGKDAISIKQVIIPPPVIVMRFDKQWFCENDYKY